MVIENDRKQDFCDKVLSIKGSKIGGEPDVKNLTPTSCLKFLRSQVRRRGVRRR